MNEFISKNESYIEELNALVELMKREAEDHKCKLQIAEESYGSLNTTLNEVRKQVPSKYHLFTASHNI